MSRTYLYDQDDFLNKAVNANKLTEQVEASATIEKTLEGIIVERDGNYLTCKITFSGVLTTPEKAALDGIAAAHDGLPVSALWLDDFLPNGYADHRAVDYKTGLLSRLYKVLHSVFRGEVREVRYYTDATKNDLVLKVEVVYTRTSNGLATSRTTTRTWYRRDGTPHPLTKVTLKEYDDLMQMQEGKRRRGNVVDQLTLDVLMMLVVTETGGDIPAAEAIGMVYMGKYSVALSNYVRTGDMSFKVPPASPNITDDTEDWLDNDLALIGMPGVTIRMAILNSLKGIMDP